MGRSILGGIAGYVVMFIIIFATFTAAYFALGADRAFNPGTYDVSLMWIAVSTLLGLASAAVGGYIAALVGRGFKAVKIMAGIIFVIGLLTIAKTVMTAPPPAPRTASVSNMEAMASAQMPVWLAVVNPILLIAAAMAGGRMRKEV